MKTFSKKWAININTKFKVIFPWEGMDLRDASASKNLKLRTMPCAIKLIYNVISKFFTDQSLFVLLQNDVNSFLVHPPTRLLPC